MRLPSHSGRRRARRGERFRFIYADLGSRTPSLLDDLMTEPPTPETKTSRNLQTALSAANAQLESLRVEWHKVGQENAALRDAGRQEAELARQAEAEMKRAVDEERKRGIEAAKSIKDEKEREKALADMVRLSFITYSIGRSLRAMSRNWPGQRARLQSLKRTCVRRGASCAH